MYFCVFTEKTRTSPYLEKGEVENRTAIVGQNVSIPCYELISGTLPDFRWLKWKRKPNLTVLNMVAEGSKRYDINLGFEIIKANQYNQDRSQLYGIELVLTNVTKHDEGFYTCLVSNHVGHDYVTMYLTIKDCE